MLTATAWLLNQTPMYNKNIRLSSQTDGCKKKLKTSFYNN